MCVVLQCWEWNYCTFSRRKLLFIRSLMKRIWKQLLLARGWRGILVLDLKQSASFHFSFSVHSRRESKEDSLHFHCRLGHYSTTCLFQVLAVVLGYWVMLNELCILWIMFHALEVGGCKTFPIKSRIEIIVFIVAVGYTIVCLE